MPQTQPDGYLARPLAGSGNGVLVLHAWWGLNATFKAFCDRLAQNGFTAFAPDLSHGQLANTVDEAEKLAHALGANPQQAEADLAQAVQLLNEQAGASARGLAVVGFSLGAAYALDLAAGQPEHLRSVVIFYGTGGGDFSRSQAAFLGHFAEPDPYEPRAGVDELEAALRAAGRPVTFYHYRGTGHWFFEPDRPQAYDPAAARLAWERTLAFLKGTA